MYSGSFLGLNAQRVMDFFHMISGGAVSFARGLNDTPKIAALVAGGQFSSRQNRIGSVAVFMAIGGAIHSRGIARRMVSILLR